MFSHWLCKKSCPKKGLGGKSLKRSDSLQLHAINCDPEGKLQCPRTSKGALLHESLSCACQPSLFSRTFILAVLRNLHCCMHVSNPYFFSKAPELNEVTCVRMYVEDVGQSTDWTCALRIVSFTRKSLVSSRNGVDCIQPCVVSLHSDVLFEPSEVCAFPITQDACTGNPVSYRQKRHLPLQRDAGYK